MLEQEMGNATVLMRAGGTQTVLIAIDGEVIDFPVWNAGLSATARLGRGAGVRKPQKDNTAGRKRRVLG